MSEAAEIPLVLAVGFFYVPWPWLLYEVSTSLFWSFLYYILEGGLVGGFYEN